MRPCLRTPNFVADGCWRTGKTQVRTAVSRYLLARRKSGVQIPSPPPTTALVTSLAGSLRRAGVVVEPAARAANGQQQLRTMRPTTRSSGLERRFRYHRRVRVALGRGKRLGEPVGLIHQTRHITAGAARDHLMPDGERVVDPPPFRLASGWPSRYDCSLARWSHGAAPQGLTARITEASPWSTPWFMQARQVPRRYNFLYSPQGRPAGGLRPPSACSNPDVTGHPPPVHPLHV
jgi:hypothetical protein